MNEPNQVEPRTSSSALDCHDSRFWDSAKLEEQAIGRTSPNTLFRVIYIINVCTIAFAFAKAQGTADQKSAPKRSGNNDAAIGCRLDYREIFRTNWGIAQTVQSPVQQECRESHREEAGTEGFSQGLGEGRRGNGRRLRPSRGRRKPREDSVGTGPLHDL